MLRVGVFMGGRSVEKEASFNSGRTVCDHIDSATYQVTPLFQHSNGELFILPWNFLHRGKISDFEQRLATHAQKICWDDLPTMIDFMFLAVHGRYAEDGILQGMLEVLGIPYLGSGILASALGMDKIVQKKFLAAYGFDVPRGILISPTEPICIDTIAIRLHDEQLSLPLVVKPHKEGSSIGVSVVTSQEELVQAIEHARTIQQNKPQAVLIEEKILGMEFSCIIITDTVTGNPIPLPPTEIVLEQGRTFFDYEQKYMPGRATKYTPARASSQDIAHIQTTCVAVMERLNITTLARIDGFLTPDKRVVIIDPNTLAGMGPTSFIFRQAVELGFNHTTLINHIIETSLRSKQNHAKY